MQINDFEPDEVFAADRTPTGRLPVVVDGVAKNTTLGTDWERELHVVLWEQKGGHPVVPARIVSTRQNQF
jgi:hypothetical protein